MRYLTRVPDKYQVHPESLCVRRFRISLSIGTPNNPTTTFFSFAAAPHFPTARISKCGDPTGHPQLAVSSG